jgi:hypothetical protein
MGRIAADALAHLSARKPSSMTTGIPVEIITRENVMYR